MTAQKNAQPAPLITGAEPQIFVTDVEAALAFYVGKLGFAVAFAYGEPPFYVQVFRDSGRLNLREVEGPVYDSLFRARNADALGAALTLEDAAPLYDEYRAGGIAFHQSLRAEPWGAKTFIVADPDGNLIQFAGAG